MSASATDPLIYMKRAIRAAEKARGTCAPNPFVGAVLVKNGKILAEGWTQAYGGDHAEIQALIKAGPQARGADLYVTLEPCSHFGKTPPCTQAIIKAGVKRVFFGISDPNPLVNGQGEKQLIETEIEVCKGFCAEEISRQLEYYICRVLKGRPFVIWKAALSLDGKYAAQDGSARWISGEKSRLEAHKLREEADVVLTGLGTVLSDDPQLNVRLPKPKKQPLRAVLDPKLSIPFETQLVVTAREFPTLLFCARGRENSAKAIDLNNRGVEIVPVTALPTNPLPRPELLFRPERSDLGNILNLREVLGVLHQRGCYCVLLECGSQLASAFFSAKLVDKCVLFYGPKLLGGGKAILRELPLPDIDAAIPLRDSRWRVCGEDLMLTGYPVFP